MSEGGEISQSQGGLQKTLGKIDFHVWGSFPHPGAGGWGKCTRVGNYPGYVGWVITHTSEGGENVSTTGY